MNLRSSTLTSWSYLAPMPLPRGGCAVGVLDGRLILAGGTYWSEGRKIWSARVDFFDPVSNRWETAAPLPAARADAAYAVVGQDFYLFGGGSNGSTDASAWRYRNGAWSEVADLALPAARRSPGVAATPDRIFVVGGFAGDTAATATNTLWSGGPGQPWKSCAPVPGPIRFSPAVAATPAGLIVAGGATLENGQIRNLDEILLYRPDTDTWSVLGRLPVPARAGFAVPDGDRVLIGGGYTDRFLDDLLALDPRTGAVGTAGRLPHALADTRYVRFGSRLLVVSGEAGDKVRASWTIETELSAK